MKRNKSGFFLITAGFVLLIIGSSFIRYSAINMPYKNAGLTEYQAAAHLLSRFSYGARPGEVTQVVRMGLDKWLEAQLRGELVDTVMQNMLARFGDINLTNTEVENIYPRNAQVIRFAIRDGYIRKDSVNNLNSPAYRQAIQDYMKAKGYKPQQNLYRQFTNQKIIRAVYSHNQLRELMTDFWFNHFNVSLTKNQCAAYVPAYERDVIRPLVFGKFEDILLATAKSPAMLMYLDNFNSSGAAMPAEGKAGAVGQNPIARVKIPGNRQGLNENYAREVMELHTMGVDGGYTQQDVTQAARILTGWTIAPLSDQGYGAAMKNILNRLSAEQLEKRGFVRDGDFLFAANRHDKGEKIVLGKKFPAGGGYEEGVSLLKMLAHHPSTAKFISRKIAVRFVSDDPPASLINKMAETFTASDGDIRKVLITMVNAPEFWTADALRDKTKSPFELAISAVRALDADVKQPNQLYTWINKMGQHLYYYQAPTGFPDKGQYWINTGSLLSRMNFGLALAAKKIPGITFNLAALNNRQEPESAEAALITYSHLLMPERNLDGTFERLKPQLSNVMAANKEQQSGVLAQVVGVIIGSPEFQRK